MLGSWVDVISNRHPRLPKMRSRNLQARGSKGHRNSKIQPNYFFFRLHASNNKWFPISAKTIDHFTVVSSVTWPLNGSEAGGDLALIQTSVHFLCKCT